jgi:hypothetical protein
VRHAAAWFEEELPCIYGVSARPPAMLKPNERDDGAAFVGIASSPPLNIFICKRSNCAHSRIMRQHQSTAGGRLGRLTLPLSRARTSQTLDVRP